MVTGRLIATSATFTQSGAMNSIPVTWTAIATRPRRARDRILLRWESLPDAPIGITEARNLAAAGELVMANRHTDEYVELVVRAPLR
jgi:hypothetical protein